MNIRKTFFIGAASLFMFFPLVSHGSVLSDIGNWFFGASVAPAGTQTASVGGALPETATWLHLTANDSHNPITDIANGTDVTLRWAVDNVTGVSGCRITYPGNSGDTSLSVAVFGSKTVSMYPSQSRTDYVEFVCTKNGVLGRDIVLFAFSAVPIQTQGGSTGASSGGAESGSSNLGSMGVGAGTNVSHTGAQVSGTGSGSGGVGGTGGGVGSAGSGSTGSSGNSGSNGNGSGNSGSIGSFIGGVIHAATGYYNTAQKGADRTIDRVTTVTGRVIDSVMNFIFGGSDKGVGKPGGDFGGKPGGDFGGGKPGIGGAGGKPGVTGGKPSSGGGSGGSGGSGSKPVVPDDDKKPSKPKGK